MPKIGNCKISGHSIFQGRPQYTQDFNHKHVLTNEIRHNILTLYNVKGIILRRNNNYMLEIDILRNDSQKHLSVLRGDI